MKNTLGNKIIYFAFLLLFGTILANSVIHTIAFRQNYINALVLQSQNLGMVTKGNVEKVLGLGVELSSMPGLSEKCNELVSASPGVSYCVITDASSKPIYANLPQFATIRFDQKFDRLSTIFDERLALVMLDGERYYNTVATLKTPDGKIAGFVQVGFPKRAINSKIITIALYDLLIFIISFGIAFSLFVRFSQRNILRPMTIILDGVQKISRSHFDTRIPDLGVYEFSELATNINAMSSTLKTSEEEVRRNYEELAATHEKLQISYLQLEGLSLEVEQSEELYKSLMEDSSDAIIVVDAREQVKMVNKMAEDFFGYSAAEMNELPLTKLLLLLHIDDIPQIHKMFKEAISGNHGVDEIVFTKKNGEKVIGRMNLSSVKSGEESLVQAIFRDITREKEILDNLSRSASDLARLNKMKDSFLGLASHELKTPLTVIMGYTELILTDMIDVVDPTVKEMVQNISNAAFRLDSIVKDMVDVSMIDEQRLQLQMLEIDLNRLLETTAAELRFFFSMRKQELVMKLDPSIPHVHADTSRLVQLFSNVLGNAIKFTPDGGTITIITSAKYLTRLRGGNLADHGSTADGSREPRLFVEVAIQDTGIGIDREEQGRIFEKFYEAGNISEHSTGKVAFKAKGAGLGLAIAKGIVEVHGGDIWVESAGYNPEKFPGSTFHILLPVSPTPINNTIDFTNLL